MSAWYYSQNGQQVGPVSWEALLQSAGSGGVGPNDLVWTDGWPEWSPAHRVQGLAETIASSGAHQQPNPAGPQAGYAAGPQSLEYAAAPAIAYATPVRGGQHQSLATTAMTLSLVSLLIGGPLLSIPGLICGWIALSRMKRTNDWAGKGKAITGVAIGGISIALILLLIVFVVLSES